MAKTSRPRSSPVRTTARNEILGDPKYVKMPVAKLTSHAEADRLLATITDRATYDPAVTAVATLVELRRLVEHINSDVAEAS